MTRWMQETDPLIVALLRPIKDLELRLAASGIWSSIRRTDAGDPASVTDVIDRLQAADALKFDWRPFLYMAAAVAIVVSAVIHSGDAVANYRLWWSSSIFDWGELREPAMKAMDDPNWTEEDRLLLYGDLSKAEGERRKTLWERNPEDPALFADYASDCLFVTKQLPVGFRETVLRIDPDNIYYDWLEASILLENVAKKKRIKTAAGGTNEFVWEVTDSKKLDEGLAIVGRAIGKTRYHSYDRDLATRRAELLREGGRMDGAYRTVLVSTKANVIRTVGVMGAFYAKASELVARQDRNGFVQLLATAQAFVDLFTESDHGTLIGEMETRLVVMDFTEQFGKAAGGLGLTEEAERLKALHTAIRKSENSRLRRSKLGFTEFEGRGDCLFAAYFPNLAGWSPEPLQIGRKEMLPGSMADHALASRGLALAAGLVAALIAIAVGAARFLSPKVLRASAARLADLPGWRDYFWVFGLGVGLPAIFVLGISYLTPWGCRGWSLLKTWPFLPTAHFIAWLLLTLAISLLISRWRLSKRAGVFGVGTFTWFSRVGWYAVLSLMVFVPLIGAYVNMNWELKPEIWGFGIFLLPVMFLVVGAMISPWFGRIEIRLTALASSMLLLPALSLFVILMMALAVAFEREDDYWFENYDLVRMDPNGSAAIPAWETAIQKSMRRELLGILGKAGSER